MDQPNTSESKATWKQRWKNRRSRRRRQAIAEFYSPSEWEAACNEALRHVHGKLTGYWISDPSYEYDEQARNAVQQAICNLLDGHSLSKPRDYSLPQQLKFRAWKCCLDDLRNYSKNDDRHTSIEDTEGTPEFDQPEYIPGPEEVFHRFEVFGRMEKIIEASKDDQLIFMYEMLVVQGHHQMHNQELADALGQDIKDVRNTLKRLNRLFKSVKKTGVLV